MQSVNTLVLLALFASIFFILVGFDGGCQNHPLCLLGAEAKFEGDQHSIRKLIYDLGIGSFLSIIFYGLLIWLPYRQKRKRLKKSLNSNYKAFKEKSISLFVGLADGSYNSNLIAQLTEQAEFRRYFKLPNPKGEDRWDAVANGLHEHALRELQVEMELLRSQIAYTLNQLDVGDEKLFDRLIKLSEALLFFERMAALDYDSVKSFLRFYWQILSGWSFTTGYAESDVVQELINVL